MATFAHTAQFLVTAKYEQYIRTLKEDRKKMGTKTTLLALRQELPPPTLNVVPLTSAARISDFIERYAKLQRVQLRLIKPNDEFDADSMIRAVREADQRIGATTTIIEHRNVDGLNSVAAVTEVTEASRSGNQIVNLTGIDKDGNGLKGNNEHFQLNTMLPAVPPDRPSLLKKLIQIFDSQVQTGSIAIQLVSRDYGPTIRSLLNSLSL